MLSIDTSGIYCLIARWQIITMINFFDNISHMIKYRPSLVCTPQGDTLAAFFFYRIQEKTIFIGDMQPKIFVFSIIFFNYWGHRKWCETVWNAPLHVCRHLNTQALLQFSCWTVGVADKNKSIHTATKRKAVNKKNRMQGFSSSHTKTNTFKSFGLSF